MLFTFLCVKRASYCHVRASIQHCSMRMIREVMSCCCCSLVLRSCIVTFHLCPHQVRCTPTQCVSWQWGAQWRSCCLTLRRPLRRECGVECCRARQCSAPTSIWFKANAFCDSSLPVVMQWVAPCYPSQIQSCAACPGAVDVVSSDTTCCVFVGALQCHIH
jgi:hypothetical protein